MGNTQILQWALWGFSLLAGVGAILALFKLRYAERFLPQWNELKELDAVLPVRRDELRQATEGIDKCRAEIGQLEATVGHLRILKEWQDANPEAPARIQQMMTDLERCKAELAAVQQKLAQEEARLTQIAQELKLFTQEKQTIEQQKASLEKEAAALRETLKSLTQNIKDTETKLRDLEEKRRQMDRDTKDLDTMMQQEQKRLVTLRQQVQQAEQEKVAAHRDRDLARADCNAAKAEMAGIQKSIEQLKDLAKGMQANLDRAGITGQGNYEDLFVPVSLAKLPPAPGALDEQASVERARDYIRGKGLVFPERVLHAFHTSLKAGDISPLVVLAGISGTGKSELPRHYADGMGIHFMLTAVQPRWDSPQDLFGFYNYLERRYKATELTRALVQFERFNQGVFEDAFEGAKIDDRSDRLLLVLLDEMNLARTEYYFSEFLSKLETRRMVDEQTQSDRARAEIELDMGGSLKDQKTLRLYPSRNVLFVGTMNEDESTQSLSDKVIDRASVLRFGRPRKTNPELTGAVKARPTNGLTFKHWMSWMQPLTKLDTHAGEVDTAIEQLNNALDRLGRPFAYRVDRAIRSYVANYPRWVPNWHKRAMADQIEQRIFPKLRGIEPDQGEAPQALRAIGGIIDQLDDEPLKRSFVASHQNQPTFLFRGVVRDESE
jgi:predicted  nucleic acid-binding Zn-ribbon protein